MYLTRTTRLCVCYAILLCPALRFAAAADSTSAPETASALPAPSLFERGSYELTLGGGAMFSPIGLPKNRPVINYALSELQLGYMLGDVKGSGWWRGNFEFLVEGFGSAIYEGPGSYVAGATAWVRYNLVPSSWRIAPYLQAGAGLVTTDIDRGLVGQPFNFSLDLGVGLRYFVTRRWSINLEYRFQHISNADLGQRNIGINAQGPVLGISCFF